MDKNTNKKLLMLPDFLQVDYYEGDSAYRLRAEQIMMSINPFEVDIYCIKLAEEE